MIDLRALHATSEATVAKIKELLPCLTSEVDAMQTVMNAVDEEIANHSDIPDVVSVLTPISGNLSRLAHRKRALLDALILYLEDDNPLGKVLTFPGGRK